VAIGGGLALWTALLFHRFRSSSWLAVAGWAAVLLSRRDGPVWATMIVLACCLLTTQRPFEVWQGLERWARWAVVAIAPLPVLTPLFNGDRDSNLLLTFTPLALVLIDLLARHYSNLASVAARRALVGYSIVGVILIAIALVSMRPGGFRAEMLRLVVANTGDHLRQLVGILGWLDTPVPLVAVFLFWAVVGALAALALLEFRRSALVFVACLVGAIVVAWLLELGQGLDYGNYWQGRYTMPFAIGLPLLLAWRANSNDWMIDRLAPIIAWSSWLILNVAFLAAQQRWGVGVNGSWYPWDWDTWGPPIAPLLLVVGHAVGTAMLATACSRERIQVLA
jgi:hypothetical protein